MNKDQAAKGISPGEIGNSISGSINSKIHQEKVNDLIRFMERIDGSQLTDEQWIAIDMCNARHKLYKDRARATVDSTGELKYQQSPPAPTNYIDEKKNVGVKFDDEKVSFHLLPPFALQGTAYVFKYGGAKYAAWNHSKGMAWSKQYRAALGHILEIGMGNLEDEESGAGHIYHAICSLMMLAENIVMYPENNDLYPQAYIHKKEMLRNHMEITKRNILSAIKDLKKD